MFKKSFIISIASLLTTLIETSTIIETSLPTIKQNPETLIQIAYQESIRQQIDPRLTAAIIKTESSWNRFAEATNPDHSKSIGLMQVLTVHRCASWDPRKNIRCGLSILKSHLDRYKNETLALAAYNGGPRCLEVETCKIKALSYASLVIQNKTKICPLDFGAHS